jgi:hypothetical protein
MLIAVRTALVLCLARGMELRENLLSYDHRAHTLTLFLCVVCSNQTQYQYRATTAPADLSVSPASLRP